MQSEQIRQRRVPVAGILLVVLGVLFLLQTTGVIDWSLWVHLIRFWPVLLIVLGLNIWLGGRQPLIAAGLTALAFVAIVSTAVALDLSEDESPSGGGTLNIQSIFGSADRNLSGVPFDGGEASSIFGSVSLDLRNATHPGGTVSLQLNSIFGSIEVRVPREWDIRIDGTPVLGSVEDGRTSVNPPEGAPVLIIDANAVFGSVTISN